ncbi:MAG TPA: aldo/keto reductase [Acidimicrobiales bacterium]|nr:aldo/keto reductase [Acidimicrobiales bacterium]
MDFTQPVSTGRHQLPMTRTGFGCAPIGNSSVAVSDEAARSTLEAAWDAGIRYFDTAPWYGIGLSEHRLGSFLRGKARDDFVISTKVGRLLRPWTTPQYERRHRGSWTCPPDFEVRFDYSYDGVVRSWEDSLQRLGLGRVELLLIHDLDRAYFSHGADYDAYLAQLITGGYEALRDLRADGKISAIGCGVNKPGQIPQFLDLFDLDFFLVAGPYTLLEQTTLDNELERCRQSGVSLVIGGALGFGVLATGTKAGAASGPTMLGEDELARLKRIEQVCDELEVPLAAVAMQFPYGHPAVRSVLFGAVDGDQVRQNVEHLRRRVPTELWERLRAEGLVAASAPLPPSKCYKTPVSGRW